MFFAAPADLAEVERIVRLAGTSFYRGMRVLVTGRSVAETPWFVVDTVGADEALAEIEAYMESGNNAQAIESFKKATADKDDAFVTPLYLYELGLAYEAANNAKDAKAAFQRIRDEYPKSIHARDIDKELARLGDVD